MYQVKFNKTNEKENEKITLKSIQFNLFYALEYNVNYALDVTVCAVCAHFVAMSLRAKSR